MPFKNTSFETLGNANGVASAWVFSAHAQLVYAAFDTIDDPWEDFEESWFSNENYKFSFTGIGTDLVAAIFGGGTLTVETFEKEWLGNEAYVYTLAGVTAVFNTTTPLNFEGFGHEWDNDSYLYTFVGVGTDLTAASFDVTPEDVEDFEEDWVSGYKYAFTGVGVDLTAAAFDVTPENYEDFEEDWSGFAMTTI